MTAATISSSPATIVSATLPGPGVPGASGSRRDPRQARTARPTRREVRRARVVTLIITEVMTRGSACHRVDPRPDVAGDRGGVRPRWSCHPRVRLRCGASRRRAPRAVSSHRRPAGAMTADHRFHDDAQERHRDFAAFVGPAVNAPLQYWFSSRGRPCEARRSDLRPWRAARPGSPPPPAPCGRPPR